MIFFWLVSAAVWLVSFAFTITSVPGTSRYWRSWGGMVAGVAGWVACMVIGGVW